jgi:hypothetical protein
VSSKDGHPSFSTIFYRLFFHSFFFRLSITGSIHIYSIINLWEFFFFVFILLSDREDCIHKKKEEFNYSQNDILFSKDSLERERRKIGKRMDTEQ